MRHKREERRDMRHETSDMELEEERRVAVLGVMEVVRLPRQMHQYLQSKHPQ